MEKCKWLYAGSCTFVTECGTELVYEADEPTICPLCALPVEIMKQNRRQPHEDTAQPQNSL